ncbi:MAG: hypothetical protein IKO84_03870 [Butyrivibrio sp.]|nr:hypothetical protein [Butyrivibrio sp.]
MNQLKEKTKNLGRGIVNAVKGFWNDESGMGTVEVILIIVVLIGLVIVFKQQIAGIVEDVFKSIKEDTHIITG